MIITLRLPPKELSPNTRNKRRPDTHIKAYRLAARVAAMRRHVPFTDLPWREATVQVSCYWPDARKRDRLNIYAWMKPAFDGLAFDKRQPAWPGMVADDAHLAPLEPFFHIDRENPRVEIEVLERSEDPIQRERSEGMNDDLVRDLAGYPMSRDYRRLWELAQVQSVVCVVDYGGGAQGPTPALPPALPDSAGAASERNLGEDVYVCRDVAHTISHSAWAPGGERVPSVLVSARGICYVGALPEDGFEGFVRQALAANLEWIVPTEVDP